MCDDKVWLGLTNPRVATNMMRTSCSLGAVAEFQFFSVSQLFYCGSDTTNNVLASISLVYARFLILFATSLNKPRIYMENISLNSTFVLCFLYRVIERRFMLIFQKKFHSRNNIILFIRVGCLFCKENYVLRLAQTIFFRFGCREFSKVNRVLFGKFLFNNLEKLRRWMAERGRQKFHSLKVTLKCTV